MQIQILIFNPFVEIEQEICLPIYSSRNANYLITCTIEMRRNRYKMRVTTNKYVSTHTQHTHTVYLHLSMNLRLFGGGLTFAALVHCAYVRCLFALRSISISMQRIH